MSADQAAGLSRVKHLKLRSLEYLNLSYNKLGGKLAAKMFEPNFGLLASESLESMYMVETDIDDEFILKTLTVLIQSKFLKNLRDLDFSHNSLENGYVPLLTLLQLHCNFISNLSIVSCKFHLTSKPINGFGLQKRF
jgi:Leucine-rich repeat (LRR) protein